MTEDKVDLLEIIEGRMELARGIESPTCDLQNRNQGVAQVVDDMGNPLVIPGDSQFEPFPHRIPWRILPIPPAPAIFD
jgi:hypothetical protein